MFGRGSIGEVGGHMSKASYLALVAASGLILGTAISPAKAADLGGGCCADLEERVAELEATTARKGNRVVSLQVYGQVNKALLYFDNGDESDVFVVDNDGSSSRFGFKGSAKIQPGLTAGYTMEIDLFGDSNSDEVQDDEDEGVGNGTTANPELRIRVNEVYIESEKVGRVTLGQGSSASDGTSEVVLANSLSNASFNIGKNLDVIGGNELEDFADSLDGVSRVDRIRYDSPSIYGFILSASWGEDDYYDVALRFKKEWNSIRIAAAVSYVNLEPDEPSSDSPGVAGEQISGSISVMHIPTGIYGAFAAGQKELDNSENEPEFWYAQLGIEKRFLSYGATTVYAEYGQYDQFFTSSSAESEATRWGFGVVQTIDSAAMDIYAQAQFWDVDDDVAGTDDGELTMFMVGSRIKF
jgi:predicted porin